MTLAEAMGREAENASAFEASILTAAATPLVARAFWLWVWPSIKDERLKVSVWVFRPSVRVSALKPYFERIFGPEVFD